MALENAAKATAAAPTHPLYELSEAQRLLKDARTPRENGAQSAHDDILAELARSADARCCASLRQPTRPLLDAVKCSSRRCLRFPPCRRRCCSTRRSTPRWPEGLTIEEPLAAADARADGAAVRRRLGRGAAAAGREAAGRAHERSARGPRRRQMDSRLSQPRDGRAAVHGLQVAFAILPLLGRREERGRLRVRRRRAHR